MKEDVVVEVLQTQDLPLHFPPCDHLVPVEVTTYSRMLVRGSDGAC